MTAKEPDNKVLEKDVSPDYGWSYARIKNRFRGIFPPLAGVVFCILAVLGRLESLCVSDGCALTQDTQVAGLSLWWWGIVAFGAVAGLILAGLRKWSFYLIVFALALDSALLSWLALTMPCSNCLIAALLFFLTFLAIRPTNGSWRRLTSILGLAWLLTFSPNLFNLAQQLMGPWPIWGQSSAPIKVFFSPSCPACGRAVAYYAPLGPNRVALYPVSKSDADDATLAQILAGLDHGRGWLEAGPQRQSDGPDQPPSYGRLLRMRLGLLANHLALTRLGIDSVPLILHLGIPTGRLGSPP